MTLTSSQLEQWFATIERNNNPNSQEKDPYLAIQFLSRFGLKNAKQVFEFLKTAGGHETINMIIKELIKEEAQLQFIRERNAEEMLKQQRLLYLLMASIAKDKALAKHVNEVIQQQIDQKLKETKTVEGPKANIIALQIMDANIQAYTKALKALDEEEKSIEEELEEIEEALKALEEEALLLEENHAYMTDHLDVISTFLQAPLFNNQPMTQFVNYSNQQVASLTSQLDTLRAQYTAQSATTSDVSGVQEIVESPIARKIRMLQDQIDFYKTQFEQPPQSQEQVVQKLIDQVRSRLDQMQRLDQIHVPIPFRERELDGLRLQERAYQQAQQFLKKEKNLLNAQPNPVDDFSQAILIIDPIADYYARRQQQLDSLSQRMHPLKSRQSNAIERLEQTKASKVEMLHALTSAKAQRALLSQSHEVTPLAMTPKPTPKVVAPKPEPQSSYSLMMRSLDCLAPTHPPAPHPKDIRSALEAIVPPDGKGTLDAQINEAKPGEIMQLGWLYGAKKLMPDIPIPELESDLRHKK